jgi:hypothetical protein
MYQEEKIEQHEKLIIDVLKYLEMYSNVAVKLVLITGVQEGANFNLIRQLEGGVARSSYQVEPFTHNDNWKNYLYSRPKLAIKFLKLAGEKIIFEMIPENQHEEFIKDYIEEERYKELSDDILMSNEKYAIAHCRLKYYRGQFSMPETLNIPKLAYIWKNFYNSDEGKGKELEFIEKYNIFVK